MSVNESKIGQNRDVMSLGGCGNTPLELTNSLTSNVCFDYLSFTFPLKTFLSDLGDLNLADQDRLDKLLQLLHLKMDDGEKTYGYYGYSYSCEWLVPFDTFKKSRTLFYYGDYESKNLKKRTNHVNSAGYQTAGFELSGGCCRDFERRWKDDYKKAWFSLFEFLSLNNCRCTKLDFAIDIFNSEVTLDDIRKKIQNWEFMSPFRSIENETRFIFNTESYKKNQFYLGSRDSNFYINIYDKKVERESYEVDVYCSSWLRFEFRCRNDVAHNMLLEILNNWNNLPTFAAGLLRKYIDLKERPEKCHFELGEKVPSTARKHWKEWSPWDEMLGNVEKAKIQNQYLKESMVTKKSHWYERSMAKMLAVFYLSNPASGELFHLETLLEGLKNRDKEMIKMVDAWRLSHGFAKITNSEINNLIRHVENDIEDLQDRMITPEGEIIKLN